MHQHTTLNIPISPDFLFTLNCTVEMEMEKTARLHRGRLQRSPGLQKRSLYFSNFLHDPASDGGGWSRPPTKRKVVAEHGRFYNRSRFGGTHCGREGPSRWSSMDTWINCTSRIHCCDRGAKSPSNCLCAVRLNAPSGWTLGFKRTCYTR